MITKKLILLCCIGLVFFSACKKETTIVEPEHRKLVIITDNDPATDIMVNILGSISSTYPEVETEFIKSKPFDIYEAAYLADIAVSSYPEGTYFAVIVEPGTNTKRYICKVNDRTILAPDNTVLSRVFHTAGITNPQANFIENPVVLGGADWMVLSFGEFYARAIVSMLGFTTISDFGSACLPATYSIQAATAVGDTIVGEILFTDNFGNCITNISPELFSPFQLTNLLQVNAGTANFTTTYGTTYSSVPIGETVCFFNSSRRLELAINYGNLSSEYHIGAAQKIKIWKN